ncbi:MAG: R3H domain-containing nucleic acid-binding protein [Candidatus Paceibacterota bacterium]|jgi:spoIIIJ-associated protein
MNNELIISIIKEMLDKMSIAYESIEVSEDARMGPRFVIKTRESGILIGPQGEYLSALSYIIKKMIGKKINQEKIDILIDINDYQEQQLKNIREKAVMYAERAKSFKTNVEMDPMSAYERMVVHTALEGIKNITTESTGEGRTRKVVIKYVKSAEEEF